jgi:hypothetical protein
MLVQFLEQLNMSDKARYSTANTQYYYEDREGRQHNLDYVEPDSLPSFWRGRRTFDGVEVSVHYNAIRTRDLRFKDTGV